MEDFAFVTVLAIVLKLLLLPSYYSTDFEVHRNWLAVTGSLPINEWYTDSTSEWTLDYPPFFAWFEWLLSQIAYFVDSKMTEVSNLNYSSHLTVLFQRCSIIISDFVYYIAVAKLWYLWRSRVGVIRKSMEIWCELAFAFVFLLNFHLILVDNIHFQYNQFLTGILLLSIGDILQDQPLWAAFWFSVLLNFKHIYLYMAPAYFIYLLRHYCLKDFTISKKSFLQSIQRLLALAFIVLGVFGVSFGPFIYYNQIPQVLMRLFPFQRGLCHAYWAPNTWALYNVADKILQHLLQLNTTTASMTGGLVQQFDHVVLPNIKPLTTFILTLLAMSPALFNLWMWQRNPKRGFLVALVLCSWSAFLFGWHVHEKAIILVLLPLLLLSCFDKRFSSIAILINVLGGYSLFPLIYTPQEGCVKVCLFGLYSWMTWRSFHILHVQAYTSSPVPMTPAKDHSLIGQYGPIVVKTYGAALPLLHLYVSVLHQLLFADKLVFFPLLLTSLYCAIPIFLAFFYCLYISTPFCWFNSVTESKQKAD